MYRILFIFSILIVLLPIHAQEVIHEHNSFYSFIENKGQWPDRVFFKSKFEGGNMWVEQDRILFHLQDYSNIEAAHFGNKEVTEPFSFREKVVELKFLNTQKVVRTEKSGKTSHYYNYFIGKDPSKWASDVHGYAEFTLQELYPGIDMRFIEKLQEIKYEFLVKAGTNPQQIALQYNYQQKLTIDEKGNLVIDTELGKIIEQAPYAYQIVNGKIVDIPCSYQLNENILTFQLGEYNKRVDLVIDPTLVFATYDGALSDNFGMTATYAYDGSAFTAGTVYGNSYPMPDPNTYDVTSNLTVINVNVATTDAFLTKYSPDGTTMLWATFFGGGDNYQGTDVTHSLICDNNNNIYVFGTTSSTDFPIVNGFQSSFGGGSSIAINYNGTNFGTTGTDMYAAKFSANGHNLLGSTYIGGSQNDGINYILSAGNYNTAAAYDSLTTNYGDQFRGEIMLDKNNNILIGSCTRSPDFPTVNAFQPTIGGQQDGVIFKIKDDFSSLLFSSYFGGSKADAIYSVKIDSSYNIVFGGGTTSLDLNITPGAYQSTNAGGQAEGFIGKLSTDGLTLLNTTYLGTSNYDQIFFIEIDRNDKIFALGQSNGGAFPVINAPYSNPNSGQFIARLDENLSTIEASTVFGRGIPKFDISPSAFLVDICGNMYVSGWGGSVLAGGTPLNGMPITPGAFQSTPPNGFDFYLIVLEREFGGLLYGSYLGGGISKEHVDGGTSRFDKNGVVYQAVCCGCGGNSDFPTSANAWSGLNLSTNCNALTFKFDFNLIPHAEFTVNQSIGCTPFEVHFTNFSSQSDKYVWDFGNGNLDSTTFEPVITYTTPGSYDVWLFVTDSVCLITDSALLTIQVYPDIVLDPIANIDLCVPVPISMTAFTHGTASSFIWSTNSNFSDTLNTSIADSVVNISNPTGGYYYIKVSNNGCSVIDSVLVEFTSGNLDLTGTNNLCIGDKTVISATSTNPNITFSNYDWEADSIIVSGDGSASVTVQPTTTQYLYVTASASNGCTVTDSILIAVSNIDASLVTASVSDNQVPVGSEITLTAEPSGYSYSWTPADNLADPNAQETTALINESTTYTVSVSDGICTKSSSVSVSVFPYKCAEPYIYVPNAFTPNGDGDNDMVFVRSKVISSEIELTFRIYDRWGEKVFEGHTTHDGWDGTFRGKPLKPDVYDYYLEGECINNEKFIIKGNITLIR
ncbi:MAG: gliding motility-associated C-terminal domain-containing protein [Brumimicrobium sp.]|nr:gliding motility-associated C-terminal domain-containing protein [Brumimicrobium sp.]